MPPKTRITLALNTHQSQKTPLLLPPSASPDPTHQTSLRALVFQTAKTKLRIKKPCRVYIASTGHELVSEEDWTTGIRKDVVLLVSSGEEFIGGKRGGKVHASSNPSSPTTLLAHQTPISPRAHSQLCTTAHTLPGIIHAVGQPDLRPGNQFPIGAVFVAKGWIHPVLIGSDIGCGMAWYRTGLRRRQVDGGKGRKVAEKLRGVEGEWRDQTCREAWLGGKDFVGEEWDKGLGTIGAGNHFAEVQVVEEGEGEMGMKRDEVVLLVHSGSRGYGGSVLEKYTAGTRTGFEEGSEEAVGYMKEHDMACQWAKANRDLIALRFLSCLEPGNQDWELGSSGTGCDADVSAIEEARRKIQERKIVDIWHNNVERVKWPPSPLKVQPADPTEGISKLALQEDEAQQDYVWIHRKGAAPTYNPETQLPLHFLPLPGSRGTPTLILQPTFSAETSWGIKNALSLAHGAGRAMSRAKALSALSSKYQGQNILEPRAGDIEGTWVICDEKELVWEEAPEAYKDVEMVGQDLVDAGVAKVIGRCRARVSYKVRKEEF